MHRSQNWASTTASPPTARNIRYHSRETNMLATADELAGCRANPQSWTEVEQDFYPETCEQATPQPACRPLSLWHRLWIDATSLAQTVSARQHWFSKVCRAPVHRPPP